MYDNKRGAKGTIIEFKVTELSDLCRDIWRSVHYTQSCSSGKSESSQVVGFLHQVGGNRIRHNKPITRYKDLLANSKQKQNIIMGIALSSVDNQVRQRACRNMAANKESNSHS